MKWLKYKRERGKKVANVQLLSGKTSPLTPRPIDRMGPRSPFVIENVTGWRASCQLHCYWETVRGSYYWTDGVEVGKGGQACAGLIRGCAVNRWNDPSMLCLLLQTWDRVRWGNLVVSVCFKFMQGLNTFQKDSQGCTSYCIPALTH